MTTSISKTLVKSLVKHFGSQRSTGERLGASQSRVNEWVNDPDAELSPEHALAAFVETDGKFKPSKLCSKLKKFKGLVIE